MSKFQLGDVVQNVSKQSQFYGMVGVFIEYWVQHSGGHLLSLRNACDVFYAGMTGPNGYPYVAQSADDLEVFVGKDE